MPHAMAMDPNMSLVLFQVWTLAFLLLEGAVLRWSRTAASKLIASGILVAILSVGYGSLAAGHAEVPVAVPLLPLTSGLMKIATLLVLGGIAATVLPLVANPGTPEAPKSQGANS